VHIRNNRTTLGLCGRRHQKPPKEIGRRAGAAALCRPNRGVAQELRAKGGRRVNSGVLLTRDADKKRTQQGTTCQGRGRRGAVEIRGGSSAPLFLEIGED